MMKVKVLLALIVSVVLLSGCSPWNSSGQTIDNEGNAISGQDPIPVSGSTYLTNSSGTALTIEDSRLGTMAKDYFVGIAEGDISGHTPVARFGYNAAVGTSSEDIWLGSAVYVFPTVAQQMSIVSNSANDSAAGTGARTVTVFYLDQLYAEQTEIVTMNGTAAVLTVATNIFRVNEFMSKTVGSAGSTVGQITISSVGGSPIFRYVAAGFNRSRGSHYTVPAGKTLFVNQWTVGVGGLNASNFARLIFRSTYNDVSGQQLTPGVFFVPQAEIITPNGFADRHFDFPMKFPATTDLKVSAMSDAGSSFIETTWRGWQE